MTTLYSHHRHHHSHTPQSPPSYMPPHYAPSTNYPSEKFHNHPSGVSPPFSMTPFSSGSRSGAAANTLPTPASSAAGTAPATAEDADSDAIMDGGSEAGSHKRRRTSSSPCDRTSQTMAPALRDRGTLPDIISPPIPTEQELLSQPDVSPYYLVCENARQPSYPDLTGNLLAQYGLSGIADSVARKTATGAKNKLRKSYKGFINDLAGKNIVMTKASQTEVEPGGETGGGGDYLATLLSYPEVEWRNREVIGKDLSRGIDMNKLRRTLSMGRGEIPGFDASILGLEDESHRRKAYALPVAPVIGTAVGTPIVHADGSTPGAVCPSGEETRPKRKRRKRTEYEGHDVNEEEENTIINGTGGGRGPGVGVAVVAGGGAWEGEKRRKKRKKNPDMDAPGATGGSMNMAHHTHTHGGGIAVHGGGYGR